MKAFGNVHFSSCYLPSLHSKRFLTWLVASVVATVMGLFPSRVFGSEQVIYTLTGGNDGSGPVGLVADEKGNLYGAAFAGGPQQAGTVFQLSPPARKGGAWTEKTLFTFLYTQSQNGLGPLAGVVRDASGNLYGTTWLGGPGQGCILGCGTVFQLSPPAHRGGKWTFTLLYDFGAPNDGFSPQAPLALDAAGNLYGTTVSGGTGACQNGCGTVFKVAPPRQPGGAWTETTLYNFPGAFPSPGGTLGGVTLDPKGALYGTTAALGGGRAGTVFRLTPTKGKHGQHWKHTLLYAFRGGADGAIPTGNVVFDSHGILYGVTHTGGKGDCLNVGCGTAYQLRPGPTGRWRHKVLHIFAGGTDGGLAQDGPIFDAAGKLVGTNIIGGETNCGGGTGCGTVYRLSRSGGTWSETVLHRFSGGRDGAGPGGLLLGAGNILYGVAGAGADGAGIVFEVTP
jgi:uncharacterized repeat protein (TIGR03803 family)